jgi:hypothetical protein
MLEKETPAEAATSTGGKVGTGESVDETQSSSGSAKVKPTVLPFAVARAFLKLHPNAKLFPAKYKAGHKPLCKWGTQSSSDPATIEKWAKKYASAYFCIALKQSGLLVVDVDDKGGRDGSASLSVLEMCYDDIPATLTVNTPSGGRHFVYKVPPGFEYCTGANRLDTGLDIPVMTPLPGSEVTGKGLYTVVVDQPIADAPAWLLGLVARPAELEAPLLPPTASLESSAYGLAALASECERLAETEEGQRNHALNESAFKMARLCAGGELVLEDVEHELLGVALEIGLDEGEAVKTFRSGFEGGLSKPRSGPVATPASEDFDAILGDDDAAGRVAGIEPGHAIPRTKSMFSRPPRSNRDLGMVRPPARRWLFDGPGGLPRGVVGLCAGQGGCGKSHLWMQLGMTVATGKDCTAGAFNVRSRGPVLLVLSEDGEEEIERRVHAIRDAAGDGLDLSGFHYWSADDGSPLLIHRDSGGNVRATKGFGELLERVREIQPVLVLVDSVSTCVGPAETDNASAAAAIHLMNQIVRAGDDPSVVLLSHVNKVSLSEKSKSSDPEKALANALDPMSVRGASALVNNARWCQTMTSVPGKIAAKLGARGRLVAFATRKTNYGIPLEIAFMPATIPTACRKGIS